jgi:glycosyltransferase involved in cell wall biosynthesis
MHFLILFFIHQGAYKKKSNNSDVKINSKIKIAVAISAKNEEAVIAKSIMSIKSQKCDNLLYDIFVIADNCSDNTVPICQDLGAICLTRTGDASAGKVGAINELFIYIKKYSNYNGILILDADDLLDDNVFYELEREIRRNKFSIIQFKIVPNNISKKMTLSQKVKTLHYASIAMHSQGAFSRNLFWETDQHGIFYSMHIIENGFLWFSKKYTFDFQWAARLLLLGYKFSYVNSAKIYTEIHKKINADFTQMFRWSIYKSRMRIFIPDLLKKWQKSRQSIFLIAAWDIIKLPNLLTIVLILINLIIGLCMKWYVLVVINFTLFLFAQIIIIEIIKWNKLSFYLLLSYLTLPFYSFLKLGFGFYYIFNARKISMGFVKKR